VSDRVPLSRDCPAKINLFLEVRARRPDGYHEVDTILQTVGLFDTLSGRAVPEAGIRLRVFGADLPEDEGNLVYRAAARFLAETGYDGGVSLRLDKRIPVQAGLGGGSSDAAGTLLLLRDLLAPDPSDADLESWAADLGSDVPFFLRGGTARATGRGERIEALRSGPRRWLVLFRPAFGLSTPAVYGRVEVPDDPRDAAGGGVFNRLEAAAAALDPRVARFRERIASRLAGDEVPVLSGSGSVFFVLVADAGRAAQVAADFNRDDEEGRAFAVRTIP
jgi:4-diphosphocytidyl-2-C-methyl-D-erythritol kinase